MTVHTANGNPTTCAELSEELAASMARAMDGP
jgi:hypothetical protein